MPKLDKDQNTIKEKNLEYVKTHVNDGLYKDIVKYIKSCDFTDMFEITTVTPDKNNKQTEDYDYLNEVWIDQYCNGGFSGDSFSGWINIKINKKEYLKFHYSM